MRSGSVRWCRAWQWRFWTALAIAWSCAGTEGCGPRGIVQHQQLLPGTPPTVVAGTVVLHTRHRWWPPAWGSIPLMVMADSVERKIYPTLRDRLDHSPIVGVSDTFVVLFRSSLQLPMLRFPMPGSLGMAPASDLTAARLAVDRIIDQRRPLYVAESTLVTRDRHGTVLEKFWVVQAIRIVLPLDQVRLLAASNTVQAILPALIDLRCSTTSPPPPTGSGQDSCSQSTSPLVSNGNSTDDPIQASKRLNADTYRNAGLGPGRVALFDSGVLASHLMLAGHIGVCADYTTEPPTFGGPNCGDIFVGQGYHGHGTMSAGLVAGDAPGDCLDGITTGIVDSYRIYRPRSGGSPLIDAGAFGRAVQQALLSLTPILLIEAQLDENDDQLTSFVCDAAYSMGATPIVTAGDCVTNTTVAAPGSACCALAIGMMRLDGSATGYQNSGQTFDGRTKPELMAATGLETAGADGDMALKVHNGTSGAAPVAAGAAVLMRNWLDAAGFAPLPGQVMAEMILSGRWDPGAVDTHGAGEIGLPVNGIGYWGQAEFDQGDELDIVIPITSPAARLEVAAWWPELCRPWFFFWCLPQRSKIHVTVQDPAGTWTPSQPLDIRAFQRHDAAIGGQFGSWTIRIDATRVRVGSQQVYWAAAVRY